MDNFQEYLEHLLRGDFQSTQKQLMAERQAFCFAEASSETFHGKEETKEEELVGKVISYETLVGGG